MSFKAFPKYITILSNMEDNVQKNHPNDYKNFKRYKMELMFKLEYLEAISIRYEEEKTIWEELGRRMEKYLKDVKSNSLSQKELQQESELLGQTFVKYSRLLMLDIDTFYLFANILLDRIPFLLRPLYRDKVTKTNIGRKHFESFKIHVDWFRNNPQLILDSDFSKSVISYEIWFRENLRKPRNRITHSCWNTFGIEIDFTGNVKKTGCKEEFPNISTLFEKIITLLEYLNSYFSERVSI